MQCTKCKNDKTQVKLTVPFTEEGKPKVLRERRCENCKHKFRTIETPAEKEDGTVRFDKGSDRVR